MRAEQALPLKRIVLTGFMGSGKTTVGKLLAVCLGWSFVDLDGEITRRTGLSVPAIFAQRGEAEFRHEEAAALAECLKGTQLVLALGGGVPETPANFNLLRDSAKTAVVYLEGAFDTLQARCRAQLNQPDAVARPNFADTNLAKQRFERRAPLYAAISTHTLRTDERLPEVLAVEVLSVLGLSSQTP